MPERVTYPEKMAHQFFYWGYKRGEKGELPVSYPDRVCWVRRWINTWGSDKLIDITGCLDSGISFACEVKKWDSTAPTRERFPFSEISARQRSFLDRNKGISWLWLGVQVPPFHPRRKRDWRMFLIPWEAWCGVESTHLKQYKHVAPKVAKSITLPWVEYYFFMHELVEHKRDWFTQEETGLSPKAPVAVPLPPNLCGANPPSEPTND